MTRRILLLALALAACDADDPAGSAGPVDASETSASEVHDDVPPAEDVPVDAPDPGSADDLAEPEDIDPGDVAAEDGAEDAPEVEDAADTEDAPDEGPPPPPFWEDLPAGYEQVHFEDLAADGDGKTDNVEAIAPADAIAFTVLLSGAPKGVWMRIGSLVTPQGNPIVKGQGSVQCVTCANRVQADQILSSALVPNAPDVPFKSGKFRLALWQFSVTPINGNLVTAPWSGTPITARVLWKTWPTEPEAGTIDLNLFFTGAGDITAANAAEHPRVLAMLAEVAAIFAPAGISLGEISYFDAPEGTPTSVETTIGPESDLAALFTTTGDAPPGINVFFVSSIVKTEIEDGSTGVVLGIAGGVPGPPWLAHGSPHSGVALALDDTIGDPDKLGSVAAHEIGHYLGLYHTIEKDGSFDPLADTAEEGHDNLMYWAWTGATAISEDQRFVALRHPSVWLSDPPE